MIGEIGSFKMKKLLLILFCLPMIGFGQDENYKIKNIKVDFNNELLEIKYDISSFSSSYLNISLNVYEGKDLIVRKEKRTQNIYGDIGKGITSAFLGYGVGNALGEVASAPIEEGLVETATKSALTKGGELASQDAINQALIQSGKQSLDPILQQSLEETAKNQYLAKGLTNSQIAQIGTDASRDAGLQLANMTAGERLGAVGSNLFSKDTLGALSQTGSYLPIAVGGGQLGAMEAQEQFDRDMKEWREGKTKRQQELYAKYPEQISPRSPYYTKQGGQIPPPFE